ncbi:unnamed protein product [Boreogadus saida]
MPTGARVGTDARAPASGPSDRAMDVLTSDVVEVSGSWTPDLWGRGPGSLTSGVEVSGSWSLDIWGRGLRLLDPISGGPWPRSRPGGGGGRPELELCPPGGRSSRLGSDSPWRSGPPDFRNV